MARSARAHQAILIVDDDQYVRDVVAASLRGIGAHLFEARTAAEAIVIADAEPLALAIVDIGLPEGEAYGYRLAAELREHQAALFDGHELRVLVLTGQVPDAAAVRASGISATIMKPFSLAAFRALVREHLATAGDGHDAAEAGDGATESSPA